MKKFFKYLTIIIFIVIILSISIPQFWKYYYDEGRFQSCEVDEDCVLVEGGINCCSCDTAINKKYVDRFENIIENPFCEGLLCKMCMAHNAAICVSGKCQAVFEP